MKTHPIRCRCGKFSAEVAYPERGTRAMCYCRDCRAYAHFLGAQDTVLDPMGGTDVVATCPRYVTLGSGVEHLACMSLSERGILRWYASCCRTPIGNTPRNMRVAYLGLVRACLESPGASVDAAFGPVRIHSFPKRAKGRVDSPSKLASTLAIARIAVSLAWSRASGRYRTNPFFADAAGTPRVAPQVLSAAERAALMQMV